MKNKIIITNQPTLISVLIGWTYGLISNPSSFSSFSSIYFFFSAFTSLTLSSSSFILSSKYDFWDIWRIGREVLSNLSFPDDSRKKEII